MTAQRVNYNEGAITIEGDTMLWTLKTDGTQYPWVTSRYQWGKSYYEADGEIAVNTERRQDDSDIIETYCFTNTSRHKVTLKNIGMDGRATCAFVFPRRVNGESAHYADAYANDQDWALLYYLIVNNK